MGGPAEYTSRHGGYEHMLARHLGLGISDDQRLRFVTLLSKAADEAGLPADPEFRAAIMGYAEWGAAWPSTTRSLEPRPPRTRPSRAGAGASRRRTRDNPDWVCRRHTGRWSSS